MTAAHAAKRQGSSPAEAAAAIRAAITRDPRPREVEEAVAKAYHTTPTGTFAPPITASYDEAALQRVAAKLPGFTEEDLIRRSPVPIDCVTPVTFLASVFAPTQRVFLATHMEDRFGTLWAVDLPGSAIGDDLDHLLNPQEGKGAFFLSNPVNGEWVENEDLVSESNPKGQSLRSEKNLTAYLYLVVESDKAPADLWLRALAQLPLPIASIVTSGGRSVHALVRVDACSREEWNATKARIAPALITLGADLGAMSAVRLTRLPCCWRAEKEAWQRLLYLNPAPTCVPISQMPVLPAGPSADASTREVPRV